MASEARRADGNVVWGEGMDGRSRDMHGRMATFGHVAKSPPCLGETNAVRLWATQVLSEAKAL